MFPQITSMTCRIIWNLTQVVRIPMQLSFVSIRKACLNWILFLFWSYYHSRERTWMSQLACCIGSIIVQEVIYTCAQSVRLQISRKTNSAAQRICQSNSIPLFRIPPARAPCIGSLSIEDTSRWIHYFPNSPHDSSTFHWANHSSYWWLIYPLLI